MAHSISRVSGPEALPTMGSRVSRQAAPRLWSEHVWPHMRRLLSPYPFQGSGMVPRDAAVGFLEG